MDAGAFIHALVPWPDISPQPVPGSVTGIVVRHNAATPATTARHSFWSLDRGGWMAAGELRAGERVASECGARRLPSAAAGVDAAQVEDLVEAGTHSYFVGRQRLWVHNGCVPEYAQTRPGRFKGWLKRFGKPEVELSVQELEEIVSVVRRLRITIRGPELGGIKSGMWKGIWHIHVGRVHLRVPPGFVP